MCPGNKLTGQHDLDDLEPLAFDLTGNEFLGEELDTNLPIVDWSNDCQGLQLSRSQIEEADTIWLEDQQSFSMVSEPEDFTNEVIDVVVDLSQWKHW